MRLFIAEKPSLARAIAEGIGIVRREKNCLHCQGDVTVTWCFGHLLEQVEPDAYLPESIPKTSTGRKIWRMQDLPIFPKDWIMQPREDAGARSQLSVIGHLIEKAADIVNAGDPDREGQLLVDEVLEYYHNTKPVLRFWSSAIDPDSIAKALAHLRDNREFAGMRNAARARSRADWLTMNLCRYYTLREKRMGSRSLVVVGRVQTPTLTLVARRDYAVKNFKPVAYLNIYALLSEAGCDFQAKWSPKEDQKGLDEEGKLLINLEIGAALIERLKLETSARVLSAETKRRKQAQPKGYSLADIQQEASKRFGFTAEQTLNVCQSLYEKHKCASYPRTDCQYLPKNQLAEAPGVIEAIQKTFPATQAACAGADLSIVSATWDDKKVTAHHAIIPTGYPGKWSAMSEDEKRIYAMIAKRYIAQFYPLYEFDSTKLTLDIGGETFGVTGNVTRVEGWKVLYKKTGEKTDESQSGNDEEPNQTLPRLRKGQVVPVKEILGKQSQTKPPQYYTEGTLIAAMENIHKAYDDPAIRAQLKDAGGIGTAATRAGIISELKRREFLMADGKKLHCSETGRSMLKKVNPRMRSAALTAQWEEKLKAIESGEMTVEAFEAQMQDFIRTEISSDHF